MRRVLWVFAHQDDEVAAAGRILEARRRGDEVWCAYLTDGAMRVAAAVRQGESRAALASLGVSDAVFFAHPDGELHSRVRDALGDLEKHFDGIAIDEVGCLAWEGGHHDHDAAHVVALAFARRRGVEAWEVPLYNGADLPGPLFRALRPVGDGWESRRMSFSDALRVAGLIRYFPSQWRTWLALLPVGLPRLLLERRTHVRRADAARLRMAPHGGQLFHERRFGVSRERFLADVQPFLDEQFGITAKSCPVCDGTRFSRRRLLPNLAVDRCESCGLRISEIASNRSIGYGRIDAEAYLESIGLVRREQAREIVRAVNASGQWLDIGCGFGFVLDEARRAGFRVRGVEPSPDAAAAARARLGDVIQERDDGAPADVISTLDVIEHLPPDELPGFAASVRGRAAVWVIKVPSSEGLFFKVAHVLLPITRGAVRRLWQSDHEHPHTLYFDRPTLVRFLGKHGFTVETIRYLDEVPSSTARQRLRLDPTIPAWQAALATPLFHVINRMERWRGKSDALLVIARSDRR